MIGFYNYSVILTYVGLAITIFGIRMASLGHPHVALLCLILSGVCDMFDGKIARSMKNRTDDEKTFGIQIDSLCDLICFGVGPALIGHYVGVRGIVGVALMILYITAAVIRLAYFNVMEQKRQQETTGDREYYQGLPVTSSAIIFPLVFLLKPYFKFKFHVIYEIALLIVGVLFILDFKVKKPDKKAIAVFIIIGIGLVWRLIMLSLGEVR